MPKRIEMAGLTFGKLTVIECVGKDKYHNFLWRCECECGNKDYVASGAMIRRGEAESCGCGRSENARNLFSKHRKSDRPEYRVWKDMRKRCNNPNSLWYRNYGGRGIKVCGRWDSFAAFLEDMPGWAPGLELDRIDVNGNYEKDNCRWATRVQNQNNKRNNHVIEYGGRTMTMSEWARERGVKVPTLCNRLYHTKMTVAQALGFEE